MMTDRFFKLRELRAGLSRTIGVIATVTTIAFCAAGVWWVLLDPFAPSEQATSTSGQGQAAGSRSAAEQDPFGSSASQVVMVPPTSNSNAGNRAVPANVEVLPESERQLSWLKPFRPTLWNLVDWTLREDALESTTEGAVATFRQPYRRLAFGMRAVASSNSHPSDGLSEVSNSQPTFEFRLRSITEPTSVAIRIEKQRVQVIDRSALEETVLRSTAIEHGSNSLYLRVTLTGDRLLAALNDDFVANVDWPIRLVGTQVLAEIGADSAGLTISEIRIDGE